MDLSVVVPCRGQAGGLVECVRSVVAQRAPFSYEVIVVDSGSDEGVIRAVAALPRVKLVRSVDPLSQGPARNLGVRHAQGRNLVFIDADCVADPDWLQRAGTALGDPAVRMVGGPVTDLRGSWIASADNLLQFAELQPSRPRQSARYLPACNMAMRREDFLSLNGFADTGPHAGEDILLCEAVLARWPGGLRFEPGMRVRHAGRGTWREFLRHQEVFGYSRARYRLHLKPWHLRLGRFRALIPAVALKRLSYLLRSCIRYGGTSRALRLTPLLGVALCWYGAGFVRGCREGPAARIVQGTGLRNRS